MSSSRLEGAAARAAALSVLEECTDALAVYQCTLKKQRQRQQPAMHTRLDIDWRMPARPEASSLVRSHGATNVQAAFDMANKEVIFEKLRQDSQWLEQLMHSAKQSLATNGNLGVLINEVTGKMAVREAEEELLAKARQTEEKLERIRREVAEQLARRKEEEERLRAELLRLRNEKEKLDVISGTESAFVGEWLASRHEQQLLHTNISRERLKKELQTCQIREENERLITNGVEAFLNESIERNEKGALDWAERRRSEVRQYERQIHQLQEEIGARRAALDELQREYNERQDFINTCLAEKEAERRRLEFEDHVRGCAIKIQAWWRGVMVRRKLGPYRPEEKKKKRPAKPKK